MTALSVKFSQALARGRRDPRAPDSRESLLLALLRKRATAHAVGAEDLEALLRDQIRWALPMERGPMGKGPMEGGPIEQTPHPNALPE